MVVGAFFRSRPKETISLPAIITLSCVFCIRGVAMAYVVIGLYAKLHTGILNESIIPALDSLYIGVLPLGTTLNVLILSMVSLFPIYLIFGLLGILGAVCKNKVILMINVVGLSFFIAIDVTYIVFFSILYNEIGSTMGNAFQGIYNTMSEFNFQDAFGYGKAWESLFNSLQCCSGIAKHPYYWPTGGIHYYPNSICSTAYNLPCWTEISASLRTYCATFIPMALLCFITEVIIIGMSDYIYGDILRKEKEREEKPDIHKESQITFPFAIGRVALKAIKGAWKRSRLDFFSHILRVVSMATAVLLIGYGVRLHLDDKMSGTHISTAYSLLVFYGHTYNDIIYGLMVAVIVIGCLTVVTNVFGFTDVVWINKTKSKMYLATIFFIILIGLTIIVLWSIVYRLIIDNMDYELVNNVRNYYSIPHQMNTLFVILSCCGARSTYDLSTLRSTGDVTGYTYHKYPESCCNHRTVKAVSNSNIFSITQTDTCSPHSSPNSALLPRQACHGVMENMLTDYTIIFMILISTSTLVQIFIAVLSIISINRRQNDYREDTEPKEPTSDGEPVLSLPKRILKLLSLKTEKIRNVFFLLVGTEGLCTLGLFILGFFLYYDEIFSHYIIVLLWTELYFNGLSFTYILEVWSDIMIAYGSIGSVIVILSVVGYRQKSKFIYVLLMVKCVAVFIATLIAVSWIGHQTETARSLLGSEMYKKIALYSDHSSITRFSSTIHGAFNNLFALGECCGVNYEDDKDFTRTLNPSYVSGDVSGNTRIPIFCCKTNPLTKDWLTASESGACTVQLRDETRFTMACEHRIDNRIYRYKFAFTFLSVLLMVTQFQFVCLIYKVIKMDVTSFKDDQMLQSVKHLFKTKRTICKLPRVSFSSRVDIVFKIICLAAGLSSMIFGVVLMYDDKMTGQYVNAMYLQVYALDVRLKDLIQMFYSMIITCSVVTMTLAIFGLSDVFQRFRGLKKTKLITTLLIIDIICKAVLLFMWIPFHSDISWNSRYQMENIFRQFYQSGHRIWNRFHVAFECCGNTDTYFLYDLAKQGWYGTTPSYGSVPWSCCAEYSNGLAFLDQNVWNICPTRRETCHPKFMDVIDKYSIGFYILSSIMVISEVLFVIGSIKSYRKMKADAENAPDADIGERNRLLQKLIDFIKQNRVKTLTIIISIVILIMELGIFIEGVLLYNDVIFSHPVIFYLWDNVKLGLHSFIYMLHMLSALMMGFALFCCLEMIFAYYAIKSSSRSLQRIVMVFVLIAICMDFGIIGLWIHTQAEVAWGLAGKLQRNLDLYQFYALGHTVHEESFSSAWNHLFATLECCGVTHSDGTDFSRGVSPIIAATRNPNAQASNNPTIPIYCCQNNPLSETYSNEYSDCTTNLLPPRFSTPCNDKIIERLTHYFIGAMVVSILLIVLKIVLAILAFVVSRKSPPLSQDRALNWLKQKISGRKPDGDIAQMREIVREKTALEADNEG